MESVYKVAGISRQGHYKAVRRMEDTRVARDGLLRAVRAARLLHPRMGARPLYRLLGVRGMGINRFERLLSESGLSIRSKRSRLKTSNGHLCREKTQNRINGLEITSVNRVWASDITYFMQGDAVFYIFMVMDIYSRRILGADIFRDMSGDNAVKVLKAALGIRGIAHYGGTLIHHSDRGSQYMSVAYRQLLSRRGIKLSTAENSLQNAYAERINGTIKNDYLQFFHTGNIRALRKHLTRSVALYNSQRPHSALRYTTPEAFEESGVQTCLKLHDFYPVDEFFSGMCLQNGCPDQKQALLRKSAIPMEQGHACAPAEPLSASLAHDKGNNEHNVIIKKL